MDSEIASWISHPWTILAFQTSLMAIITGFTKSQSIVRLAALPFFFWVPYFFIKTAEARLVNRFRCSFGAAQSFLTALQYLDVALLSKWDFSSNGPAPSSNDSGKASIAAFSSDTFLHRLAFGFYASFSHRNCGTSFEVKNVPPFDANDASYKPTKTRYLITTSLRIVIAWLLLDAMTSFSDPADVAPLFKDERIALFSRWQEVSMEELVTRAGLTFMFWLLNYLLLVVLFNIPGVICVATGITGISWWRPIFNPISDAYTLRNFWGFVFTQMFRYLFDLALTRFNRKFWHQALRNRISNPATFVTRSILGISKGSFASSYSILLFTFAFSSLLHGTGDLASGIEVMRSGSFAFFVIQAGGIMLEDLFHAIRRRICSSSANDTPELWERIFGWIWVSLWLIWCTPIWSFPVSGHGRGDIDAILPFSILRGLS